MAKFFRFPFAATGTKIVVPDAVQADGAVSYPTGWGVDYERNPVTDPAAKLLPRPEFNQVMFDITDALRTLQIQGTPDFITAADNGGTPFAYPIGAVVRSGGRNWISQIANNTQPVAQGTAWRELNALVASDYAASQTEADAGTVVDKYVTPGVLRGGVRNTILTGISFTSGAAVVATDTILAAIGKLQKRTADLDASRVQSVTGGTNVTVDNADPRNPIISAPGSDVPGAPVKATPIVWGDLAVITDSEDGNALKRATFLNIRNVLKAYFDTIYTAAGSWLPLAGGTLTGALQLRAAGNKIIRFLRDDNTISSSFYAKADATGGVTLAVNNAGNTATSNFDFNVDGSFAAPSRIAAGASGALEGNGNVWGSLWGTNLWAFLQSTSNSINVRAYPRRSDGGALNFRWAGQGGTPAYVWGIGEPGTDAWPYSPSNFSVNYAGNAGNANSVGGWSVQTIQDQDNWRVTDARYAGYIEYSPNTGNVWIQFSSGYVATGWRINSSNACNGIATRQPQIHIPNAGWRPFGGW